MTLTLKFDKFFKNFNFGDNFWIRRVRDFIVYICIPSNKTFHTVPAFLVCCDKSLENYCNSPGVVVVVVIGHRQKFNLGQNLWATTDRIFIFHLYTVDGLIFVGYQFSWFSSRVRSTNSSTHKLVIFCMNFEGNSMTMNFEPHEYVIFVRFTKIGTNENKAIHSIPCDKTFHIIP